MWRTVACDSAKALSTLVCRMRWYSVSGKSTKALRFDAGIVDEDVDGADVALDGVDVLHRVGGIGHVKRLYRSLFSARHKGGGHALALGTVAAVPGSHAHPLASASASARLMPARISVDEGAFAGKVE